MNVPENGKNPDTKELPTRKRAAPRDPRRNADVLFSIIADFLLSLEQFTK